jgi:biotin-dependent carboxylase-like uncharacterized protein
MTIEVVKPGALSTLQDLGRSGFQHLGVPVGGVMDERAHRVANLLAGNPEGEATLEITLMGPSLRFTEAALIALAGADLSARLGGQPVPLETPILVRAGSQLEFGARIAGMRAYLAVHGGFVVATVMGSKSTYLRGGFGGFEGRALRKGDVLPLAAAGTGGLPARLAARLRAGTPGFCAIEDGPRVPDVLQAAAPGPVRVIAGRQWQAFAAEARQLFLRREFRLGPQSDRMGFRLEGPRLCLREPLEMISEAVAFGTIQVPPDGNPIVLMADRQTTGGYPKIASVASVDLPALAQRMPHEGLRFTMIALQRAQELYLAREAAIAEFAARCHDAMRERR